MISVIIPVFNRPEMLVRAVRSVLEQESVEFELVVVDDGSTESLADAEALVSEAGGTFLKVENSGVSAARNIGVLRSSGEWIAFLDSDDIWLPGKLAAQLCFHEQNPNYVLSQCEELWTRNGRRVNKKHIHAMARGYAFEESLERCCISPSSVMIRRDVFEAVGGFDERMPVCEDYDLWLRLTCRFEVGYLEEPLVHKFGGHSDQLSQSEPAMDRFRLFSILKLLLFGELSHEQIVQACKIGKEKARILELGAEKRAPQSAAFYRSVKSKLAESGRSSLSEEQLHVFSEFKSALLAEFQAER